MAIRIYSEYEEFDSNEGEVSECIEDQSTATSECYDDDQHEDFGTLSNDVDIREDAKFYIVSDIEDEEVSEEIASMLGKYNKIDLNDLRTVFFYIS